MRTGMRLVQECASRVALNAHVLRTCQPGEGDKGAGLRDLCFVVIYEKWRDSSEVCEKGSRYPSHTMRSQIRHTTYCVALNLDVGAEHLPNEGLETAELHDEQLVVSCRATSALKTIQVGKVHTIYGKVS